MTHLKRLAFCFGVVFLLVVFYSKAQGQESIRFYSYGETPKVVNDSLYIRLKKASNVNNKLSILYTIANAYLKSGNADSVQHYGHLLKDLCIVKKEAIENIALHEARAYRITGNGKTLIGLYDEAIKAYLEGIEKAKKSKDAVEINNIKLSLGEVYLRKKEYKKADSFFKELILQKNTNNISARANFYLGTIAFDKNNFWLAKEYFIKAATENAANEDLKFKLWIQLYQAKIADKENRNDIAFDIYEDIMSGSLKNSHFDIYTEAVLEYGNVCLKLEEYQMAEIVLSTAYTNAIQWNRLELQKKIINSLRRTYNAKGDFENAYNLMTQYLSISNEISEQQNSKLIKDIEIKYETVQKENEIYELKEQQRFKETEIERQKTIKKAFLYGFLVLLIPIIGLLYVYYQKLQTQSELNKRQKELNNQKITSLLNTQELELARNSLGVQQEERHRIAKQLHDSIGGNLAGIKLQLANIKSSSKLQKDIMSQVNETYELVRDISHDLVPKKFHQNTFTFLLEKYTDQLQKNTKIEITFSAHPKEKINELPEKLKVETYQIIQELFTNTLKHAEAKNIEFLLNIHDQILQLIFEDDGIGFKIEKVKKGIGLQNIESRLKQLDANLIIDSSLKRGTVITIEIPLKA